MGKIKEQNTEQEEKEVTEKNTVIEAPDNVTGDEPVEDKQEETAEAKYKAKVCIYYSNKKIMPGEVLSGVEADTIHSLLKNGFVELI